MSISNFSLNLYRKTIKRFHVAHVATHWIMEQLIIPVLERTKRFYTIADDPFWFRLELLTNRHETETMATLDRLIQPGMVFLDIGAHVGYYSHRYAKKVGTNGRIISFEPHPRTFTILQQNVSRFSNVIINQIALSEKAGTAELHDYLIMSASGSLKFDQGMLELQKSQLSDSDIAPRIAEDFPANTFTVQTRPVDDCLADLNIDQVDVIKMDIEGAEIGALRGMRNTIKQSPNLALVMEYNPQALHGFGHDPENALVEVMELGFSHLQLIEDDGSLTDFTANKAAISELTNKLMAHMGVVNCLFTR
ncbi:MAG: FkbM family methyltransferase [Chloroflexi bacterium]|nr:FkbM family methyltransferase [Chloroflexota bacterium]